MKRTLSQAMDRRIFGRFNAAFPSQLKSSAQEEGNRVSLRDISGEGARVQSTHKPSLNDPLTLLIDLPDGHDPLALDGFVVWTKNEDPRTWQVGIRFKEIDLMNLHRLFKLCQAAPANAAV